MEAFAWSWSVGYTTNGRLKIERRLNMNPLASGVHPAVREPHPVHLRSNNSHRVKSPGRLLCILLLGSRGTRKASSVSPSIPNCRPFTEPYDRAELIADALVHAGSVGFALVG